jgi:hypothetical protein
MWFIGSMASTRAGRKMHTERSLQEIEQYAHSSFPDAREYRVVGCLYEVDFESHNASLVLVLKRIKSDEVRRVRFANPHFEEPPFIELWDATGLYLMDTSHLGWGQEQRIEVGDWDGGPPIFWASDVEDMGDAPASQF